MLVRLLYASRAADLPVAPPLDEIVTRSQAGNVLHGITGVLCWDAKTRVFLQVIEGGRAAVNQLYANLINDPRHHTVTILDYAEITERHFAGWRMGRVEMSRVNVSTLLRFGEMPVLEPFSMTGPAALALMLELSSTAAVTGRGGQ